MCPAVCVSVYVFHTHTEMLINLCGCNYHSNPDERPERDLPVKGNQHSIYTLSARHPRPITAEMCQPAVCELRTHLAQRSVSPTSPFSTFSVHKKINKS